MFAARSMRVARVAPHWIRQPSAFIGRRFESTATAAAPAEKPSAPPAETATPPPVTPAETTSSPSAPSEPKDKPASAPESAPEPSPKPQAEPSPKPEAESPKPKVESSPKTEAPKPKVEPSLKPNASFSPKTNGERPSIDPAALGLRRYPRSSAPPKASPSKASSSKPSKASPKDSPSKASDSTTSAPAKPAGRAVPEILNTTDLPPPRLMSTIPKDLSHLPSVSKALSINTPLVDWNISFYGVSSQPVTASQYKSLSTPIDAFDVQVKPDGVIYLPEIKYRRKLNETFGPMGWGMVPKGDPVVGASIVTREYALLINGRFASQSQGENNYFSQDQLPAAVEGCKSNALMRCCKDLGIASELWDPLFIRWFKKAWMEEVWVEHVVTKKKRIFWFKKNQIEVSYPYKLSKA